MPPEMVVTLNNQPSELERLHQILVQFGKDHQLPDSVIHSINLALEEVVVNVMTHGYKDKKELPISIHLFLQKGQLIAEIEDQAPPFNPLTTSEPNLDLPLESRPIGGLGIHLVKKMIDTMEYSYKEGKNCLTIKKRIEP